MPAKPRIVKRAPSPEETTSPDSSEVEGTRSKSKRYATHSQVKNLEVIKLPRASRTSRARSQTITDEVDAALPSTTIPADNGTVPSPRSHSHIAKGRARPHFPGNPPQSTGDDSTPRPKRRRVGKNTLLEPVQRREGPLTAKCAHSQVLQEESTSSCWPVLSGKSTAQVNVLDGSTLTMYANVHSQVSSNHQIFAHFVDVGRIFCLLAMEHQTMQQPSGWEARTESAKDLISNIFPFPAVTTDRSTSVLQHHPPRPVYTRGGFSPLPRPTTGPNAPFTPGEITRLLENTTPTVPMFRLGSSLTLPRFTRPNPPKRRVSNRSSILPLQPSLPSAPGKSLTALPTPSVSGSSPSASQLDDLGKHELEPDTFTSPNDRGHFGTLPNHDHEDGLNHFSDDLLNTPHPFAEDLIDDASHEADTEEQRPSSGTHDWDISVAPEVEHKYAPPHDDEEDGAPPRDEIEDYAPPHDGGEPQVSSDEDEKEASAWGIRGAWTFR